MSPRPLGHKAKRKRRRTRRHHLETIAISLRVLRLLRDLQRKQVWTTPAERQAGEAIDELLQSDWAKELLKEKP